MIRAAFISIATLLLPSAGIAERSMTCVLKSELSPQTTLETRTIVQDPSGQISMLVQQWDGNIFRIGVDGTPDAPEVLFQHTTRNGSPGDRFTTVATSEEFNGATFVPVLWLIDWEEPSLQHTQQNSGTGDWSIGTRFECVSPQ
ncbi:hypothetical protein [Salibaculum griseiflavum]|uniref:hypothetical protein n=1 Tax=Salibaculum griseiflavum TaxID=1914409 RepID=UPI001C38CAF3|nr:hypothetical protein [Salibaculum griseiflavum]